MAKSAAFFDLDKTLLAKSSTLAYAKPLFDSGLLARADVLRSAYGQFVYLLAGANASQMDQARAYMSDLVAGWDVSLVSSIVNDALGTVIEPIIYAEALTLFD
ncbi:MAG: HAD-IB family hydrolase, partial [Candidatus Nanopelagicales bacterium]